MDNETLLLKLNLQFFAKDGPGGEKTEPATSKKLNDIRKEGQVAKSKELITAVSLMSLFIILKIYLSKLGTGLIDVYTQVYNSISKVVDDSYNGLPIRTAGYVMQQIIIDMIKLVIPILFSWRIKGIASDFSLKFCSCEFELLTKTNVIDFVQKKLWRKRGSVIIPVR